MSTEYDDQEVQQTLEEIVELGFVAIRDGKVVEEQRPVNNLCSSRWDRWSPTLRYLRDYAANNEDFGGEFFVCLYDGWREYSEPAMGADRRYVPWREIANKQEYLGIGNAGEPRFRHSAPDFSVYPELVRPVLAYDRHVDDRNVRLIPDAEFLENGFQGFLREVNRCDVPWYAKAEKFVWRGSANCDQGLMYYGNVHPRYMIVCNANDENLNVDFGGGSPAWMLGHKYILDIDGMVNAWSGLYWKLASNSAVVKMRTHWEQWYYNLLRPYEHYLPFEGPSDLQGLIRWANHNDHKCNEIAQNGKKLVATLTYDWAVKEYKIR